MQFDFYACTLKGSLVILRPSLISADIAVLDLDSLSARVDITEHSQKFMYVFLVL